MSKPKQSPKTSAKAVPEATPKTSAPETPTVERPHEPKPPRLSESLKAQADRMIAARDKKKGPGARPPKTPEPEEDLVVFAFRLTATERELIHKAAGPAKASRFVRVLAVAAAKRDEAAVRDLLATVS
jgi:hypothetical protein